MLPFELPPTGGGVASPVWNGRYFECGGRTTPVLEYSENFAGWTEELTAIHEDAAGKDGHPIDIASRKDALRQVRAYAPLGNPVIMEVGCSSGYFTKDLVKSFPDAVIIATDVIKAPLYRLANEVPGVPLIRFDLLRCPLPEHSVDVVVMLNVLEHIDDDAAALRNVFKVLKPGGALVIEVPAFQRLYDAYDAEVRHFRRYSASELSDKLAAAGFTLRRTSYLGFVLFPAFAVVKLFGKRAVSTPHKSVVHARIGRTAGNPLVKWAMHVESACLSSMPLPFGIRVLAVAVKQGQ